MYIMDQKFIFISLLDICSKFEFTFDKSIFEIRFLNNTSNNLQI